MKTKMYHSPKTTIHQMQSFLQLPKNMKSRYAKGEDVYKFIREITWNSKYKYLDKNKKGVVIRYLSSATGYSYSHTKRLVSFAVRGKLKHKKKSNKTSFKKKYTREDIKLLAEFDKLANYPNGIALQEYLRRMYEDFKDERFKRLSNMSHGHIYNLRKSVAYRNVTKNFNHTKPVSNNQIGIREKPRPDGKPGYIRVDSVHGGDHADKGKGVYYVNFVDEVTQYELVVCVKGISQYYLKEVWEDILTGFPFKVINFHSDNGSEFINNIVAKILNQLNIRQTKSRPRRHNDNGLVESKNGWVIRKHFGYTFVHKDKAPVINKFLKEYFNTYLNYHRPCAFPDKKFLPNGKKITKYKRSDYQTPYDKLRSIDPHGKYLADNVSYSKLDKIAYALNDFDYLKLMNEERFKLYRKLKSDNT